MIIIRIDEGTLFCVNTNTKFILDTHQVIDKDGKTVVQFRLTAENIFNGDRVTIAEGQDAVRAFKEIRISAGWPPVEH
jgi:hypothetical protein